MKATRWFGAAALALALGAPAAPAQDSPKPGPEHDYLKKMVGNWDITMTGMGAESKGTVTYKMDLGGLWLTSTLEADLGGTKFSGRGFDTYDAAKKKYVGVWVDSMSTQPMVMEGTYDKEKKSLTLVGDGPGLDGKPAKWKSVSNTIDDDTFNFSMYVGDTKEPMFTIVYKRKK